MLRGLFAVALALCLAGCNYYELDAGGDIGFNNNTAPLIDGGPGADCKADTDCLSQDCNDAAGVCR